MAKILFVDDETLLCDLTYKYFSKQKHKIDTAENYDEAIKLIEFNEYDVILADIHMPGLKNGIDLLKTISTKNKSTQFILITGNPSLDSATEAIRCGAFDYITKPFKLDQLQKIVEKALEKKVLKDENDKLQNELKNYKNTLEETIVEQIYEIHKSHKIAASAHIKSLEMLAKAAEYHDDFTGLHINRVGEYSYIVAKNLGLSEGEQDVIKHAAPMHDVGKVGIPYQIITKPTKLTPVEFTLMKKHCSIGYSILKDEEHPYHKASAIIALSHHEKYNGSGYPYELSGNDIPLFGRIVSLVDVFDALVSTRIYKSAWEKNKAIEHIKNESGTHFDPEIVECFFDSINEIEEVRSKINEKEKKLSPKNEIALLKEYTCQYNSNR